MTVQELIEFLKTMPPDAVVIYQCCSEFSVLEADEIDLKTAESKRIIWREANGYSRYVEGWHKEETPDFRTVVTFPGN